MLFILNIKNSAYLPAQSSLPPTSQFLALPRLVPYSEPYLNTLLDVYFGHFSQIKEGGKNNLNQQIQCKVVSFH